MFEAELEAEPAFNLVQFGAGEAGPKHDSSLPEPVNHLTYQGPHTEMIPDPPR